MAPRSIFSLAARTGIVRCQLPLLACGALSLTALHSAFAGPMPQNLALGLRELALDYQTAAVANGVPKLGTAAAAPIQANYPLARFDDRGRVHVEVTLDGTVSMEDAAESYTANDCTITAKVPWYHQGVLSMWMPLNKAATIAKLPGVDSVKLSLKPRHYAGKVPGQGAKVLNALAAQTNYNTLGAGVTVGAQSDSYNATVAPPIRCTPPRTWPAATCPARATRKVTRRRSPS